MCSVDRLQVDLRVPVTVEDYHNVRCVQVDAQPTRARAQNKDLLVGSFSLEVFNTSFAVVGRGLPVDSAILVASEPDEVVEDVEKTRHLGEDEYLVAFLQEPRHKEIEHLELLRGCHKVFAVFEGRARFNAVKEVGVVAYFFELHQHVEELNAGV